MKTLFDYQKEIVQKANKSNALFMKMGTGKTITSLKIAEKWKCEKNFTFVKYEQMFVFT